MSLHNVYGSILPDRVNIVVFLRSASLLNINILYFYIKFKLFLSR